MTNREKKYLSDITTAIARKLKTFSEEKGMIIDRTFLLWYYMIKKSCCKILNTYVTFH
ncbi:hypothetical protein ASN18_2096 [Candidatus Magnetominusculus xianensis]|uniref:Uncharacterized protein n=1 Tax=Candidatus Magnetominusculus xianensis TaxID=1748249 RepID=A0ABR5SDZ4_9BACT|nr:hypothetical protein ASN18_2096 [Candidatus Magnetominusculus xianensis]